MSLSFSPDSGPRHFECPDAVRRRLCGNRQIDKFRYYAGMVDSAFSPHRGLESATDPMAVLKLYVDLANSERQAIWARYATMVVGNSLIFSAIFSPIKPGVRTSETVNLPYSAAGILLCAVGFLLCLVWVAMTWVGWSWYRTLITDFKKLKIPESNPFEQSHPRHPNIMFFCAMSVPFIFMLVYIIGLVYLMCAGR
ncbi:MAG: RipA family octameric membrane protein [Beijerinckiaceae bacterium]